MEEEIGILVRRAIGKLLIDQLMAQFPWLRQWIDSDWAMAAFCILFTGFFGYAMLDASWRRRAK